MVLGTLFMGHVMAQRLPRLSQRSQLRIQQLNMILRLVEQGSVSAAAEDLRLSQSAVTKSLKEVESIFGVPLFHRDPRGMRPTPYCEVLERFARDTVLGLDETIETIRAMLRGEEGIVCMGASPGEPQRFLASELSALKADLPRMTLQLRSDHGPALLAQLEAGTIDFAVMPLPPAFDRERYAYVPLGEEAAVAVVHPRHPLLRAPGIGTQALLESAWALPPRRDPLRESVAFALMASGVDQPPDLIEVHSSAAALDLASDLDMVTVVPESLAAPYVRDYRLQIIRLPFTLQAMPYGLVRFRRRQLRPGAFAILRLIGQRVRERRRGAMATRRVG